jgi:uncharacterized SAM-binding protein YcdF (DUF218 family)
MRNIANEMGVSSEFIILEDESLTTIDNMLNVRDILLREGIRNVVLVTSDYHIERSKVICDELWGPEIQVECLASASLAPPQELEHERLVNIRMNMLLRQHLAPYL